MTDKGRFDDLHGDEVDDLMPQLNKDYNEADERLDYEDL